MKEFLLSILALFGAIVVSLFMLTVGTVYSFGYSIWLSITLKKWYAFLLFWWRLIDGFFAAIGHLIYQIAYSLDLTWNVNGEILEDWVTAKEDTEFTKKKVPVSASIGKLEIDGDLNAFGEFFSKLLNIAFWQKNHAVAAWMFLEAKRELRRKLFVKR